MTGFESKRKMAKAKLDDDDDTQVYADTLLIVYQRGFADGKRAAEPEQQAEPVADGNKVICPACCHQFRAIPTAVQTLMLNAGFEPPFVTPPAAQRQWQGLEAEEILDLFDRNNVYGSKWIEFARTVEAKLKERNT